MARMDRDSDGVRARAEAVNQRYRPTAIANDTVTRVAGPAGATVHSFLRDLRAAGVTSVPQPLALDGRTETLSFLPGESGGDGWRHQHDEAGLRSAARLLRELHDAGAHWRPPDDAVFGAPSMHGEDVVWCHGDPGPWNFVWHDGRAVGLIDWDYLHPAPRIDDVAYALFWFAPMRPDTECLEWHHFAEVPDRRERVRAFLDAYGGLRPFDVVDAVVRRCRRTVDHMRELAREGIEPQRTWVADGLADRDEAEIDWVEQHRALLTP